MGTTIFDRWFNRLRRTRGDRRIPDGARQFAAGSDCPDRGIADSRQARIERPGGGIKGFTLLEVIVALIIAGMAATVLLESAESGLHATRTATMYDQAIVRAKSRLAAATEGPKLVPGDFRGNDGGGFRWRLHVAPLATAALRPMALARSQAAPSFPVVLYSVNVWVSWKDGDTTREVRLDTEQVGG